MDATGIKVDVLRQLLKPAIVWVGEEIYTYIYFKVSLFFGI